MKKSKEQKKQKKQYENYVEQFTPKSKFISNNIKAFVVGGLICVAAFMTQNYFQSLGMDEKTAGIVVTITLIFIAQFLTGIGIFDDIARFSGAGVIVPITGFANSMVATAMEYKNEGLVLGVGSKMFALAGPVLVCGISVSVIMGIIYYLLSYLG